MPVAETNPRRAVLVGLAAIVFAAGLLAVVVVANGADSGGGGSFDSLEIETLLDRQARDGVPTCFNDPISGNRPICVFHTGEADDDGWAAYDAQVDGCGFETLSPESTELVDSCTGERYPFSGEGLPQYETSVRDGRLVIALTDDGTTTTASSSSSSTSSTSTTTG